MPLRLVGCLLLFSGWLIVVCAIVVLSGLLQRSAFVTAGFGVEVLGLVSLTNGYKSLPRQSE